MAVCVSRGSSSGADPGYAAAAGIELVYGGGSVGLMGVLAAAALAAGGRVTGVMPRALVDRETAHRGLTALDVVETMHERKTRMAELADGFVALPSGAGTLEEIRKQRTSAQLGIHAKPCAFLNVGGYFDPLRAMIGPMVEAGFLRRDHAEMLAFETEPAALLARFRADRPPVDKWAAMPTGPVRP